MKKMFVVIFVMCCLPFLVHAEKVLATHTVNETAVSGYAVNTKGDIITYTVAKDGSGLVVAVTYDYTNVKGTEKKTGEFPRDDFPTGTTDFEIVSLARKNMLVTFSDGTTIIYASYRLKKNQVKQFKNGTHTASDGEVCWMHKSKIFSLTYVDGEPRILRQYSHKWKLNEKKKVIGDGVISEINPPMGKEYVDEAGTGILTVRVIKP